MQTKFVNFKKRDKKGRRLSIFAEVVPETGKKLHIFVYTCSLEDQFSRKISYKLHEFWEKGSKVSTPKEHLVSIVDNKPLKTFIKWCNDNYYIYEEVLIEAMVPVVYNHTKAKAYQVGKIKTL